MILILNNCFFQANGYVMDNEKSGQALCPYDPQHNSTAVFVGKFQITLSVWGSGLTT
jgi:semaphorin 6